MLIVDPVKRITISEIRSLHWFQTNLPRYLQILPSTPSATEHGQPPIGDLASLIASDSIPPPESLSQRRGSQDEATEGLDGLMKQAMVDPEREAKKRGWVWTRELGVIDPRIVEELEGKMHGWKSEDIWEALKREGENQVKVAFQLVRDHRRLLLGSMSRLCFVTVWWLR